MDRQQVQKTEDPPAKRPGVPMEAPPSPAGGAREEGIPAQPGAEGRPIRAGLEEPTPVFGTAQPLHGMSGRLRRLAYDVPEHRARHWMLLMAADRVDVAEDRLAGFLAPPLRTLGLKRLARRVRADPITFAAATAAGLLLIVSLGRRSHG